MWNEIRPTWVRLSIGKLENPQKILILKCYKLFTVWFQDFPDGWGRVGVAPTPDFGAKHIIWQDLCPKLHKNQRNWGRGHVLGVSLGSATGSSSEFWFNLSWVESRLVMMDPGFPREACKPWCLRENLLFGKIFCRKLHKNEWNLTDEVTRIRRSIRQCLAQTHAIDAKWD